MLDSVCKTMQFSKYKRVENMFKSRSIISVLEFIEGMK